LSQNTFLGRYVEKRTQTHLGQKKVLEHGRDESSDDDPSREKRSDGFQGSGRADSRGSCEESSDGEDVDSSPESNL